MNTRILFRCPSQTLLRPHRVCRYLLGMLLLGTLVPGTVSQTYGQVYLPFAGGAGTAADPYRIANASHLNAVRIYPSAHFLQVADIDLAQWNVGEGWLPIGTAAAPFTGVFDGGRHVIRNLNIDRPGMSSVGLFGVVSEQGKLRRLRLQGVAVTGSSSVGALVGVLDGFVLDCSAYGNVSGWISVGGLVGRSNASATIAYSYTSGEVRATSSGAGGLIGENSGGVMRSHSTSLVDSTFGKSGGLIGAQFDQGAVVGCYAVGDVSGGPMASSSGGLVGELNGGMIARSFARGQVGGLNNMGGLVGWYGAGIIFESYASGDVTGNEYVGGLVGWMFEGDIVRCFSVGRVTAVSEFGGLVGFNATGAVTHSYWDTQTSNQALSAGGMSRTTAQMTYPYAGDTFVGWDFGTFWFQDVDHTQNSGYPYLLAGAITSRPVRLDFDGDGRSDLGYFFPPAGTWHLSLSWDGLRETQFGFAGTIPIVGDFDGDGEMDFGCYHPPTGMWYLFMSTAGYWETQFGFDGTIPIVGDFDGDGRDDFGCYHPPSGNWFIFQSRDGFWQTQFGFDGTIPIVGDFDGDGRDDFGCYHPPSGGWYIFQSREGFWQTQFGFDGTIPIVGDFDGDGRDDFGCYHPPSGGWFIFQSTEGFWQTEFGFDGTIPVIGDFDGDGRDDLGCYHPPSGNWFIFQSRDGFRQQQFGHSGTLPLGGPAVLP